MGNNLTSHAEWADCMDFMAKFPDEFFDLAIPDVPYGIGVTKMNYVSNPNMSRIQKNGTRLRLPRRKQRVISEWDNKTPPQEYFDELRRVSKHQIIFGADYCKWEGLGPGRIKWNKCIPEGMGFSKYETAYCSMIEYEHEIELLWSGMQQAHSLNSPTQPGGNKKLNEKRIHPTQKPVLLYLKILMDFAKPGWNILDTHLGSGSSRIAADKFGCNFWGCEKDEIHFNDQEERWNLHSSNLKLNLI